MTGGKSSSGHPAARVAIVGGGVIGLACGCELARRGHSVSVFDPGDPRQSSSWAAAGMIAPAYELMLDGSGAESPLTRLCFESAALWPDFAAHLRAASGLPLGYDTAPTFALARSSAELERLDWLEDTLPQMGMASRRCTPGELYERLGVSKTVLGGLALPGDHQIDNRRLLGVMRTVLKRAGADFVPARISDTNDLNSRAASKPFDAVIWARGIHETGVDAPVKGQAIALHPMQNGPRRVLRFGSGYIVPKPDRIVIGATSETEFDHAGVTPANTARLLEDAASVLPALSGARVMEAWAGLRPFRTGGKPLIGPRAPGEFVAAAHYRNGVLLAPATAKRIADLIEGKPAPDTASHFAPSLASDAAA